MGIICASWSARGAPLGALTHDCGKEKILVKGETQIILRVLADLYNS